MGWSRPLHRRDHVIYLTWTVGWWGWRAEPRGVSYYGNGRGDVKDEIIKIVTRCEDEEN